METEEYPRDLDDSGCVQDECSIPKMESPHLVHQVGLLDLSDDVLLCILKNCAPMELKALAYTCPRLARIALEWSLWMRVDARAEPYDRHRLHWLLKYALNKRTTELMLRGHAEEAASCEQFARSEQERLDREEGGGPRGGDEGECARPSMAVDWEGAEVRYNAINNGPAYVIREMPVTSQPLQNTVMPPFFSSQTRLNESATETSDSATGCAGPRVTVFATAMKHISEYCNLTSLALEYCNINLLTTGLDTFPRTLTRLSLRGTRCYNMPRPHKTFLFKLHDYLPDLEYLNVSDCGWLEASSFLALSKLASLRQLIVKDCSRLSEFVAYAALATRYGFKKLEVLDLRGSPVGDSELSAFALVSSLRSLRCSAVTSPRGEPGEHVHAETSYEWERQEPEYLKKFELDVELLDSTDDRDQKLKQHVSSPETEPCGLSIVVSLNELRREQIEVQRWRDREANNGNGAEERNRDNGEERDRDNGVERDRIDAEVDRNVNRNTNNGQVETKNNGNESLKRKYEETDAKETGNEHSKTDLDKSVPSVSGEPISKKRRVDDIDVEKPSSSGSDDDKGLNDDKGHSHDKKDDDNDDDMNGGSCAETVVSNQESDGAKQSESNADVNKTANTEDSKTDANEPSTSKTNANDNTNKASNNDSGDKATNEQNSGQDNENPSPFQIQISQRPVVVLRGSHRNIYVRHYEQFENNIDERELRLSPSLNARLMRARPGFYRHANPQNLRHPVIYVDYAHSNCHHPSIAPEMLDPNYRENLVTDLAIMRFGVSNVEGMTHIRLHFGARPAPNRIERTNLEELVITGYRLITDASLVHLATAAPMLRRLDLRGTRVTSQGVETFKTLRPECEVLYTETEANTEKTE